LHPDHNTDFSKGRGDKAMCNEMADDKDPRDEASKGELSHAQILPHAYVISLPEATLRRERVTKKLQELKIPYEIFEAVDGRQMDVCAHPDYDIARRHRYFGRDLQGGELGCLLSHRAVLEKILADGRCCALVLEDDAILDDSLTSVVISLMQLQPLPEFVRFIASKKLYRSVQRKLDSLTPDHDLVRMQGTPGTSYAYFVSSDGAKKLHAALRKIYLPVDTVMGYAWSTGVDNLVVIPSPVTHNALDTHIGDARFDKSLKIKGLNRALYPFTRFYHKTSENIMKRVNFLLRNHS
jgi:glycosyl transferase family 25